jgi:hypothetical protein
MPFSKSVSGLDLIRDLMRNGVSQGAAPDYAFPEDNEPVDDGPVEGGDGNDPNDWGSESEEDDGFEECIEVISYPNKDRPPFCRRRDDQEIYCMRMATMDRGCRKAVAILTAEAGTLVFACEERGLRAEVEVSSGLHIFAYCLSNLVFKGFMRFATSSVPAPAGIPQFTIASGRANSTWLRVETSMGPFRPMARGYVFPLERESPSLLAGHFQSPVPLCLMLMPAPCANLENFLPSAKYYYVCIHSVVRDGPLLDRDGYRIVDVERPAYGDDQSVVVENPSSL